MRHCQVREVMTTGPVAATPATPLKSLADTLVRQKVSAVPVVSVQGKIVGVVSEADLLEKEEVQWDPDGRRLPRLSYRARRVITTAETAGELMSTHPVTVRPDATVAEAARLLERHQAACLPVVDGGGMLLGVVSPRDLLRVLLRPDDEIRADIIRQVLEGHFGTNPARVRVEVTNGVVRMTGEIECKSMLPSMLPLVRAIDGVIDVEGEFTYAIDDTSLPRP
jgi:CBS domain-containing protein